MEIPFTGQRRFQAVVARMKSDSVLEDEEKYNLFLHGKNKLLKK